MRTSKQKAKPLNAKKQKEIEQLFLAFSQQKRIFLNILHGWKFQALLDYPRRIRDKFVNEKYESPSGLQGRHWKLSLQDAIETWVKYWESIFVQVRSNIASSKKLTDEQRHYANWILNRFSHFAEMMQGKAPKPPFEIDRSLQNKTVSFVQKQVNKHKGKSPAVKKARSAKFDENCYKVFENNGTQYVAAMSLTKGERIVIPLEGKTKIKGNITLVCEDGDLYIHVPQKLKTRTKSKKEKKVGTDFGYTEVITDHKGKSYGKDLGKILTKASDRRHEKGKKRNKLHALEKKYRTKDPAKAARMRKYNLGKQKLNRKKRKDEATIDREINTAFNELIKEQEPTVLITENLSHTFTFNKPKSVNRRLSSWVRGKLQERIAFKALAEGFRHEQVNPAYGSQICPNCDFVDSKNRNGDKFKCLHCGHEGISEGVAALNYLKRHDDLQIGLYVPYSQVKIILLERFQRRLEAEKSVTVPGRTLDTVAKVRPQSLSK